MKVTAQRFNEKHEFSYRRDYMHAKIGVFVSAETNFNNSMVCFGDTNHVASISLVAGMEVR